jgi:diaminopimelate epimerase
VRFVKMQGAGNDFLLVETEDESRDWGPLAAAICERHYGAGADGLILVLPSGRGDVRMRLFNADGSEAEVSGNGVRCLAKYVIERGLARAAEGKLTVEAASGLLVAEVAGDRSRVESVRLSMGAPRFEPDEVPVLTDMTPPVIDMALEVDGEVLAVTCLSMGNPHAVAFFEGAAGEYPLERLGPRVERHAAFPARVNFGVAFVESKGRMDVRVWERGVGETLACGSGSCAAMVAARLKGLVGERVDITQPGGELTVEWDGRGEVFLSGGAEFVYEGDWPEGRGV